MPDDQEKIDKTKGILYPYPTNDFLDVNIDTNIFKNYDQPKFKDLRDILDPLFLTSKEIEKMGKQGLLDLLSGSHKDYPSKNIGSVNISGMRMFFTKFKAVKPYD